MRCIIDSCTNPFRNLAREEVVLCHCPQPVLRLWRNSPSVIIGRHQNALSQVYAPYLAQNNIPIVRRLSGGGAVYHDLGNVNFSFFDSLPRGADTTAIFARFTEPILNALQSLGVDARLEGRNDLYIDGRKFSGNACARHQGRVLVHGTLLFSAGIKDLSKMLRPKADPCIDGKTVASRPAGVCNISEYLPSAMDVEEFIKYLGSYLSRDNTVESTYTAEEEALTLKLEKEKYSTVEWNYGHTPDYSFRKSIRYRAGTIEVYIKVSEGLICDIRFFGDYFFLAPTKEMEALLMQCPHNPVAVQKILDTVNVEDYFQGITCQELLACLF